ncbi:hypothetical protein [Gryllotalpicola ginsengisoli]|uniref:hypothetical protein n=1 Tax=Gryllotalpicola ginsengisoli TaxID=444608 RepID=UPI0003B52C81|nr:hypothetical protein [Gryllotalpicola ginsengisoli]
MTDRSRFWRFYEKANAVVRTFTGPADIGAGHAEEPEVRRPDAACPICGKPMNTHTVVRHPGDIREPSRLLCP